MATNCRFAFTKTRSLPVAAGIRSGDPVKVGSLVGVALTDRNEAGGAESGNPADHATVALDGAFDLEVTGSLAAAGTPVYIDSSGDLTATVGSNTLFGYSIPGATDGSKGSGAGIVTVEIAQV